MYKLLVTDLDGSIIDETEKISCKNIRAVEILRKNNIDITIATGRRWFSVQSIVSPLKIKLPVILYNGAGIYDPTKKQCVYIKYLSEIAVSTFLKLFRNIHEEVKIGIYYKETLVENKKALELMSYDKSSIIKIFLESTKDILNEINKIMENYLDLFTVVYSSSKYLEILPINTSKGRALKRLIKILGIKKDEVIALGDYDNDEDLLKFSGLSITLENASEKIKRIAKYNIKVSPQESLYEIVANILKLE